jgi:hypothetical protein
VIDTWSEWQTPVDPCMAEDDPILYDWRAMWKAVFDILEGEIG